MEQPLSEYTIILLAVGVSLCIPLGLRLLSFLLTACGTKDPNGGPPSAPSDGRWADRATQQINFRFFSVLNVTILLVSLAMVLIPCVSVFRELIHSGIRSDAI